MRIQMGKATGGVPPTFEEERRLIVAAQGGCIASRNALIEGHFGFIIERVAASVRRCWPHIQGSARAGGADGENLSEWLGYGVEAFCAVIMGFDPAKAVGIKGDGRGRLLTYAGISIERKIGRAIRQDTGVIRVPDRGNFSSKSAQRRAGASGITRAYDDPEYTEPARRARSVRRFQHWRCGGATMAGSGVGGCGEAMIEDLSEKTTIAELRAVVAMLPARERMVVELRLEGLTLSAVGRRLGITREWVRQLELGAHGKMREMMGVAEEGGSGEWEEEEDIVNQKSADSAGGMTGTIPATAEGARLRAKLSMAKAGAIRAGYDASRHGGEGVWAYSERKAREYGVSTQAVYFVMTNRNYHDKGWTPPAGRCGR